VEMLTEEEKASFCLLGLRWGISLIDLSLIS
jgi:hypothetical protein